MYEATAAAAHHSPLAQLLIDLGPAGTAALVLLAMVLMQSRTARRTLARCLRAAGRRLAYAARLSLTCAYLRIGPRLARRLERPRWRRMVESRQLSGLVRGKVRRTKLGVAVHVHLAGSLTLDTLNTRTVQLETGLGLRRGSVRIVPGKRADRAVLQIVLRDPHAKPIRWSNPGPASIRKPVRVGLTEFGEPVTVSLLQRIVVGGTSGAGKSSVLRVLCAAVAQAADAELVYVDPKGVEGSLWRGVATVVTTPEEIRALVADLKARMRARLDDMEARGVAGHVPTAKDPAVIVVVDEGAELSRAGLSDTVADLESLAQLGRAAEFRLWWASQYLTASSGGLPRGIGTQAEAVFGMRVEGPLPNRVMFNEEAERAGWTAHRLPRSGGWFLLRDAEHPEPERARAFFVKDDDVRSLPRPELPLPRVELAKPAGLPAQPLPVAQEIPAPAPTCADAGNAESNGQQATAGKADLVIGELLLADAPLSGRQLAQLIGSNPGTTKRLLERLQEQGAIRNDGSGWVLATVNEPAQKED